MNKQEETMTPAQEDHETRRRRLLRFGVAAPMVLTLRPGSSFGASTTCAQRLGAADQARAEAAEKLATSPDADEWVRAQVDIVELHRTDLDVKALADTRVEGRYVLGTDGVTYWRVDGGSAGVGPLMPSTKSTPRVSDSGAGVLGKDAPVSAEFTVNNSVATPIEKRWALVKFDPQTGTPLGYSWEPQAINGVCVSDACLASMNGLVRFSGTWDGLTAYVKRALGLT